MKLVVAFDFNCIILFSLCQAHGQVHASLWNNLNRAKSGFSILLTDPRYLAGSPTQSGHLDNFDTPYNIGSNYGMRLWTYFLVPETGYYTFVAAADDMCQVFLSTSRDPKNKLKIIEVSSYTSRYQFEK